MKMRVKIENETFEVEVGDLNERPILAKIGAETFEVWPEAAHESAPVAAAVMTSAAPTAPVAPTAAPVAAAKGEQSLCAPIPGTIISISVKAGDSVSVGQELCILEAMKMKNAIRSKRAGVVAAVHVHTGQTVAHNQPLFDFAD